MAKAKRYAKRRSFRKSTRKPKSFRRSASYSKKRYTRFPKKRNYNTRFRKTRRAVSRRSRPARLKWSKGKKEQKYVENKFHQSYDFFSGSIPNWNLWATGNTTSATRYLKLLDSTSLYTMLQGPGLHQRIGNKVYQLSKSKMDLELIMPFIQNPSQSSSIQLVLFQTRMNMKADGTIINSIPWQNVYDSPEKWRRLKYEGYANPYYKSVKISKKKKYTKKPDNAYHQASLGIDPVTERLGQIKISTSLSIPKGLLTFYSNGDQSTTITAPTNRYWELYVFYTVSNGVKTDSETNSIVPWDNDGNLSIWNTGLNSGQHEGMKTKCDIHTWVYYSDN